MILLSGTNPLTELVELLNTANPDANNYFTANNIKIQNVSTMDPADSEAGHNTTAEVIYIGDDETTGVVPIEWTRIKLSEVYPWIDGAYLQIDLPQQENNYVYLSELESLISLALGTQISTVSEYQDYVGTNHSATTDVLRSASIAIKATSLRYVPETFKFYIRPIGRGLPQNVKVQSVSPFKDDGEMPFKDMFNRTRTENDTTSSLYARMGGLDFTSALGRLPATKIVDGYWTDDAFIKINAILATNGLPPLPTQEVTTTSYYTGSVSTNGFNQENVKQFFGISISGLSYDYYDLIDSDETYLHRNGYLTFGFNNNDEEL